MKISSTLSCRLRGIVSAAACMLAMTGCGDDATGTTETDGEKPPTSATSLTTGGTTDGTSSGSGPGPETTGTTGTTETTTSTGSTGSEGGETNGSTGETGGEEPTLIVDFPLGRATSVEDLITVRGHVTQSDTASIVVRVAGADVVLDAEGTFTVDLPLLEGANTLTAELLDADTEEQLDVIEREVVRQLLLVEPLSIASGPGHDFVYLADGTHGIVAAHKQTGMRRVLATPDTTSAVVLVYDHVGHRLVLVDRILDTLRLLDPDDGAETMLLDEIPGFQISWARMDAAHNRVFLGYGSSTPPLVVDLDTGESATFAPGAPWSGHFRMGVDPVNNRTFARGLEDWLLIDLEDESHQLVQTETLIGAFTAGYVDPSGAAGYRVREAGSPVVRRVEFETWDETAAGGFPSNAEFVGPSADEHGLLGATIGNHPFGYEIDVVRTAWDGSGPATVATNRFPETMPEGCNASGVTVAGRSLFSLCFFGGMLKIDLDSGAVSEIAEPYLRSRIVGLEFDPGRGVLLVLLSDPGDSDDFEGIARYDLRSGTWEEFIATSAARSGHFDFDPLSDSIVVSSSYPNSTAVIFDAESGALTQSLNSINDGVDSIAIDADAVYYLPTASAFVNRYDRASGAISLLIDSDGTPAGGTPWNLQVDEEGNRLLSSTGAGRIIAIDRSTGGATTLVQGGLLEPHQSDGLLDTGASIGDYEWMPDTQNFVFFHRRRVVLQDFVTGEAVTLAR